MCVDAVDWASVYKLDAQECEICRAVSETLTDLLDAAICDGCLRRIDADPREKRALLLSASQPLEW
jgi:nitric oxide synthase oxygenase domain/subunit